MSQIGEGPDPGGIPVEARKKALTHSNNSGTSVPCAADTSEQTRLFDAPKAARASMYAPAGRRRFWWFAYQCALREAHFGRVEAKTAEEAREKASRRYARCGGIRIPVRVERVYGEVT